MIALLESDGPGDTGVRFCMASALATLVLDEDVMILLKDRGEAPTLFVHSIEILKSALGKLALDAKEPPCLLYTSPSPRDATLSRMPSSA